MDTLIPCPLCSRSVGFSVWLDGVYDFLERSGRDSYEAEPNGKGACICKDWPDPLYERLCDAAIKQALNDNRNVQFPVEVSGQHADDSDADYHPDPDALYEERHLVFHGPDYDGLY